MTGVDFMSVKFYSRLLVCELSCVHCVREHAQGNMHTGVEWKYAMVIVTISHSLVIQINICLLLLCVASGYFEMTREQAEQNVF